MALVLPIRLHPQKESYNSISEWPPLSWQAHWMPGSGNGPYDPRALMPGMAHTHLDSLGVPIWACVDRNNPVPINFIHKLFDTSGSVDFIGASFIPPNVSPQNFSVTFGSLPSWPPIGNPTGLIQTPFIANFDIKDAYDSKIGIPDRGFFGCRVWTRTLFNNGDYLTMEAIFPLYSIIDPEAPEVPLGEAGIQWACKLQIASGTSNVSYCYQQHLTEIRDRMPILAPIKNPHRTQIFGYNYGADLNFPPNSFLYTVHGNADIHNYIEGTALPTKQFGLGNLDYFYPQVLNRIPKVVGQGTNDVKIAAAWIGMTQNGFNDTRGGFVPPGRDLRAILVFPLTIDLAANDTLDVIDYAGTGPEPQSTPKPPPIIAGPPTNTIFVPDIVGQLLSTAQSTLTSVGLQSTSMLIPNSLPVNTVISQNPPAGASVLNGTAIQLMVSSGPAIIEEICTGTIRGIHIHNSDGTMSMTITNGSFDCNDGTGIITKMNVTGGSINFTE